MDTTDDTTLPETLNPKPETSRLLNFFWFYKIVKIALRGGRTKYMNEDKIE